MNPPTLPEPADLSGFPASPPPPELVRVCPAGKSTWWSSSDGSGRFDLRSPEGTCYFATDEYAAIREASRLGPVTTAWVAAREVRKVAPPSRDARLAATTRKAAGGFGVTTELATVEPYDLPQRWAAAFRSAGFNGIRHQLRHDQRARPSGVSWFGAAGDSAFGDGTSTRLTADQVERSGVDVIRPARTAAVRIVD